MDLKSASEKPGLCHAAWHGIHFALFWPERLDLVQCSCSSFSLSCLVENKADILCQLFSLWTKPSAGCRKTTRSKGSHNSRLEKLDNVCEAKVVIFSFVTTSVCPSVGRSVHHFGRINVTFCASRVPRGKSLLTLFILTFPRLPLLIFLFFSDTSWHLLDGLPFDLVQIFMVQRGGILITCDLWFFTFSSSSG